MRCCTSSHIRVKAVTTQGVTMSVSSTASTVRPVRRVHEVEPGWRDDDRVGFTYLCGGPPEDQFSGLSGLRDIRSAPQKRHS